MTGSAAVLRLELSTAAFIHDVGDAAAAPEKLHGVASIHVCTNTYGVRNGHSEAFRSPPSHLTVHTVILSQDDLELALTRRRSLVNEHHTAKWPWPQPLVQISQTLVDADDQPASGLASGVGGIPTDRQLKVVCTTFLFRWPPTIVQDLLHIYS